MHPFCGVRLIQVSNRNDHKSQVQARCPLNTGNFYSVQRNMKICTQTRFKSGYYER